MGETALGPLRRQTISDLVLARADLPAGMEQPLASCQFGNVVRGDGRPRLRGQQHGAVVHMD